MRFSFACPREEEGEQEDEDDGLEVWETEVEKAFRLDCLHWKEELLVANGRWRCFLKRLLASQSGMSFLRAR